jgi:hypothetical protein
MMNLELSWKGAGTGPGDRALFYPIAARRRAAAAAAPAARKSGQQGGRPMV